MSITTDRYDRDMTEAFAIRDEISQAIVRTLRGKLTAPTMAKRYTPHPEAYAAFL